MPAKYIFAVLAIGFLLAAVLGGLRRERHPAIRTWLLIGAIFGLVSVFLFAQS
jgi:DMSO reductase anchor subunit